MQPSKQSSPFSIHLPEHIDAFANPLRVRVLMLCAGRERSLSDLQRSVSVPLNKLHYHVSRLLESGLLLVNRAEPRAGRAIRYYQAVAGSFVVPQDRLPELPSDKLSSELRRSLAKEQGRTDEGVLLYSAGAEGKVLVKLTPREQSTPSRGIELWRLIKLGPTERTNLTRELNELLERYSALAARAGGESFLVHAAFAPANERS